MMYKELSYYINILNNHMYKPFNKLMQHLKNIIVHTLYKLCRIEISCTITTLIDIAKHSFIYILYFLKCIIKFANRK